MVAANDALSGGATIAIRLAQSPASEQPRELTKPIFSEIVLVVSIGFVIAVPTAFIELVNRTFDKCAQEVSWNAREAPNELP